MKGLRRVFAVLLGLAMMLCSVSGALAADEGTDPVILLVTPGTGDRQEMKATVEAAEKLLAGAFPGYDVRSAFTDPDRIESMAENRGVLVDSVEVALDRLADEGVRDVIVQPALLLADEAWQDAAADIEAWADRFDSLRLTEPLLGGEEDLAALAEGLAADLRRYDFRNNAVVLVGEGTDEDAAALYAALEEELHRSGHEGWFVGALDGEPGLASVMEKVAGTGRRTVVLVPLLFSGGVEETAEILGGRADSWRSAFQQQGYMVAGTIGGLGRYGSVRSMIVERVRPAAEALTEEMAEEAAEAPAEETAEAPAEDAAEAPAEETTEAPTEEAAEAPAEENAEAPAEEAAEAPAETVPGGVIAADLAPGIYEIEVLTSSSRFRVSSARLEVEEGTMTAELVMADAAAGEIFLGTARQAETASEEDILAFERDEDGRVVFRVPVSALDAEIPCAVWSLRQGRWIDRTLVFPSEGLAAEAFRAEATEIPAPTEPETEAEIERPEEAAIPPEPETPAEPENPSEPETPAEPEASEEILSS